MGRLLRLDPARPTRCGWSEHGTLPITRNHGSLSRIELVNCTIVLVLDRVTSSTPFVDRNSSKPVCLVLFASRYEIANTRIRPCNRASASQTRSTEQCAESRTESLPFMVPESLQLDLAVLVQYLRRYSNRNCNTGRPACIERSLAYEADSASHLPSCLGFIQSSSSHFFCFLLAKLIAELF